MQLKNVLILIGTFWPVLSVCLAIFIAFLLMGWQRWLMLFVGPVLFFMPCYIYAEEIGYNGNMLFVALFGLVFALAFLYYPILTIAGIVTIIKNRKRDKQGGVSE